MHLESQLRTQLAVTYCLLLAMVRMTTLYKPTQLHVALYNPRTPELMSLILTLRADSSYVPQLVPYAGQQNKVTLVQGARFDPDFYQLDLVIASFPTIFRQSDLPTAPSTYKSSLSLKESPIKASVSKTSALDRENWRHKSPSVKSTKYDSDGGAPIGTSDFTNELPAKATVKEKTKPCRYYQKVS
jgi:hypothetical protein